MSLRFSVPTPDDFGRRLRRFSEDAHRIPSMLVDDQSVTPSNLP